MMSEDAKPGEWIELSGKFLPREALDTAIEQVMICHRRALDGHGLRIFQDVDPVAIEKAICELIGARPQEPMRAVPMPEALEPFRRALVRDVDV